ncbi:DHA2 family efflux MFS transporter permease subunit [Thermodesulforhabdus norvegica]|uniref:MFS transporter, DHA2 family, multidrug resistance protein n=1 Tax=Thermodesulforhabdus norvegica TaxID=39841 RepID=A0A1I4UQH4_9BACT|nr:DHA2 family efflux MFS transporter permease subunit [Thermodesulforhabdus norvegica]SFM91216.1 MFS transporter, DHA2 family, multidrug resistance protein [Thermodesulforhabdus norvegica]
MSFGKQPQQTNKWIVAFTVILPTFIEVMDTSVVNVSLPHIRGSLSAGVDEVTWVLTSYLVSNAIIIPITGWLAGIFGRKNYLIFSLALFTGSSLLCGAAPSLEILIIARILQGLGGGGLQPLSQAILLETFPPREHGIAMAVFGMGVVFAPILGPVVGGWITDNWSWRWVFYINLPVGIISVLLTLAFIFDPPYIRSKKIRIDYWGLGLLAVGLGCLQVVLDKGEREDWFESNFITTLSIISALCLIVFVIVELRSRNPVVDLRILKDRSFAFGNIIMFTGFFCMFGSIVLLPLYLQNLMGYTALWAGLVLGPGGIASFLIMPVAGNLMKRGVKPHYLLALGLFLAAYSFWMMSRFNLEADFLSVAVPRIVLGFGMGLFFVPLGAASYVNIPKEKMGTASGIFNLLRNLGGSFGTAVGTTVLSQRSQFHQNFLVEHITPFHPSLQHKLQEIMQLLGITQLSNADYKRVLAVVYQEVLRQASMMGFNDTFWLFCIMTSFLVPLALLMKGAKGKKVEISVH